MPVVHDVDPDPLEILAVLGIVRQERGEEVRARLGVAPAPAESPLAEHGAKGVMLWLAEALIHVPVYEEPLGAVARGIAELPWPLKRIAGCAEDSCDEPAGEVVQVDSRPTVFMRGGPRALICRQSSLNSPALRRTEWPQWVLKYSSEIEVLGEHVDALELAVEKEPHRPRCGNDSAGGFGDVIRQRVQQVPANAACAPTRTSL